MRCSTSRARSAPPGSSATRTTSPTTRPASAALDLARANRFTAEPDAPGPISPLYAGLGRAEATLGLPPLFLFHLPQVLAALLLPAAVWWCVGGWLDDRAERRWAVFLALIEGGIGAVLSGSTADRSADVNVTELTAGQSVAIFPHFAVAFVGLALAWGAVLRSRDGQLPGVLGAAASGGLLLGASHGFLFLPLAAVVGGSVGAALLRRDRGHAARLLGVGAVIGATAAPFVLDLARQQADFERQQGSVFPARPSAALWTWVAGVPVLLALAVAGLVVVIRSRRRSFAAIAAIAWAAAQSALLYAPVTVFQRRYVEGLVIPFGMVAGIAAARLVRDRPRAVGAALACLVAIPAFSLAGLAGRRQLTVDRPTDAALDVLTEDDVVAAGFRLSWELPALSSATSFAGRDVETLHHDDKEAALLRWAAAPTDAAPARWFATSGITAILIDERDPTLRLGPDGGCLRVVVDRGPITLLRPVEGCFEEAAGAGHRVSRGA